MKFYIATKLENHSAHNRVMEALQKTGHVCTYDWTIHGPVYTEGLARVRQVAILEWNGVYNADVVIVLWPGGRGTHVELGMALALAKRVIFVSNVDDHHEATTETCAFYHHPAVKRFRSESEAIAYARTL